MIVPSSATSAPAILVPPMSIPTAYMEATSNNDLVEKQKSFKFM
jgi:hypothetical protein